MALVADQKRRPKPDKAAPRKTALGQLMSKARARLGITQEDAAKRVGITRTAWSLWETGRATPAPAYQKLIRAFCASPDLFP